MRFITRLLLSVVLLNASVFAQASDSGLFVRVGGNLTIARDERVAAVLVVDGDARISGVAQGVLVVGGNATLDSGQVEDLTVVKGHVRLTNGAQITKHLHLLDSDVEVDATSRITGTTERSASAAHVKDIARAVALIAIGAFAALLIAGVLGAAMAPRLIRHTGRLLTGELPKVALAWLVVWVLAPVLAVALVPTVVGLPVGIGYFLFVIPVFLFLGLIVAGTTLGDLVLGRVQGRVEALHPWVAALIGVSILLLLGRVPVVGLVAFVAVQLGAAAVALAGWRSAWRYRSGAPEGGPV